MDVRVSVAQPAFDADTNVLGCINLLEGAREGGVRRFIFASSGGVVYGEQAPPLPEEAQKLPASPYGVSKLAGEHYLHVYQLLHGLETVSLRYANVYGPRQDPHGEAGVVAIFGERLGRGESVTVFGDGRQTRDYVFVGDVARANVLASDARLYGTNTLDATAYNIGTGVETSVLGLAELLAKVAGRGAAIHHEAARAGELARSALQVERARRELGWRPTVSLEDGLRQTYAWITRD
jgi:UDP-glucose 4-epimerase